VTAITSLPYKNQLSSSGTGMVGSWSICRKQSLYPRRGLLHGLFLVVFFFSQAVGGLKRTTWGHEQGIAEKVRSGDKVRRDLRKQLGQRGKTKCAFATGACTPGGDEEKERRWMRKAGFALCEVRRIRRNRHQSRPSVSKLTSSLGDVVALGEG